MPVRGSGRVRHDTVAFVGQERFDGALAWETLPVELQARIGAAALELAMAWYGQDAYQDEVSRLRPFEAADRHILAELQGLLASRMPAFAHDASGIPEAIPDAAPVPIPSLLGSVCRRCGCSEEDACSPPCGWAAEDLCTACAGAGT